MKKVSVIIFAVALVVGLVAVNFFSFGTSAASIFKFSMNFGRCVRGSGHISTEKRSVSGFTAIETGGIYQVTIVAQKEFGLEVEADDNLLPLITTEVHDGVLRIGSEKRIKSASPIRIRVSAPDVDRLDISGVADVTLSGLSNSKLDLEASGASKVTISGETTKIVVDVSGASRIYANDLRTKSATIDASGASHVSVNVSEDIRSDISGASSISYSGSPRSVVTHKSGAGSIAAK